MNSSLYPKEYWQDEVSRLEAVLRRRLQLKHLKQERSAVPFQKSLLMTLHQHKTLHYVYNLWPPFGRNADAFL